MQAQFEKIPAAADSSFATFVRADPAFRFGWHYHPEYELTLIARSRGQRFVGDNIAGYSAGDLVLLGPNLPHTWASAGPGRVHRAIVVQFRRDFLGRNIWDLPEFRRVADLLRRSERGLQFTPHAGRVVARQLAALTRQRGLARLQTLLTILDTLAAARGARTLSSAGFAPSLRLGDQARMDRACRFIDAHLTERIAWRDVARETGLSPRAFSRFFKRNLGKTPVAYLNELRVGRACSLLINTDRTVTEICFASGFNNLAYFNRRFRALRRRAPRAYRRAYAPGPEPARFHLAFCAE